MQGTIVMLVALSGLGCHHKACDVTFAPSGYYCMGGCLPEENETDYPAPAYARGHMHPAVAPTEQPARAGMAIPQAMFCSPA